MTETKTLTPESRDAVVHVRGLVKVYRDFWHRPRVRAVDGIDMDLPAGGVFGLLGPNGSGKSTTIKILLGLLFPTAGTVRVLDDSPRAVSTKRLVGYLPEESYLYRYLTARETLHFYGRLFNLSRRERHERVDQLLHMVGLEHAAERPVGEFSKGMARRVGLAQALINDPRLLILDEPTSGLDPMACRQVKDIITALAARGKTILLTSHLLADVEDVCDRIAILYSGTIRAQGTVKTLLSVPDQVSVRIPALAPDAMRELLRVLREHLGSEPHVEYPAMDLEHFFLSVIGEASDGGAAPTGAARGGAVAPFLAGPPNA